MIERRQPLVGEVDETALWTAVRQEGSADAREAIFRRYLPYARKIAGRHFLDRKAGDIEFGDLYQLACAGLLEAIDGFDPNLGTPFAAYSGRRISGSVVDGVNKASEVREQISFRARIRRDRLKSISPDTGQSASASDAMDALIEATVGLALGFMLEGSGLYAPDQVSEPGPNAYESLVWKEAIGSLHLEMKKLPPREQLILTLHYTNGMNFHQIGSLLHITKGRVSQLHRSALASLKIRLKTNRLVLER